MQLSSQLIDCFFVGKKKSGVFLCRKGFKSWESRRTIDTGKNAEDHIGAGLGARMDKSLYDLGVKTDDLLEMPYR